MIERKWTTTLVVLAVTLAACGSGGSDPAPTDNDEGGVASTDGESTPPTSSAGETPVMPPLLAVDLARDENGTVTIEDVGYIPSVVGAYRPWGSRTGELAAVAYDGERIVDATFVSFLSELSQNADPGADGVVAGPVLEDTEIELSRLVVHLDASEEVDRVDIVDRSMNVLASTADVPVGSAAQPRVRERLFRGQPWIRVLDATDTELLPDTEALAGFGLKTPTVDDIERIGTALDAMPTELQRSILSIAILDGRTGPGYNSGGNILLSDDLDRGYELAGTLVHEAAHGYSKLSRQLAGRLDIDIFLGDWHPEIRSALQRTHERMGFGLLEGVLDLWADLHADAVTRELALDYGSSVLNLDAHRQGFVTGYAADNAEEDFSESVRVANLEAMSRVGSAGDLNDDYKADTCRAYQTAGVLEREMALAYIKLQLVHSLGLADARSIAWCVGDLAPTNAPGIDFPVGVSTRPDTPARDYTFTDSMNAGYTGEDREEFIIVAQDSASRGIGIELVTDGAGSPLGVYVLDPLGVHLLDPISWNAFSPENELYIAPLADDNAGQARTAVEGVVVITYARSDERVDGFVFDLTLIDALRGEYRYDFVPFRIPLDR